jgi:hypothetical protein
MHYASGGLKGCTLMGMVKLGIVYGIVFPTLHSDTLCTFDWTSCEQCQRLLAVAWGFYSACHSWGHHFVDLPVFSMLMTKKKDYKDL